MAGSLSGGLAHWHAGSLVPPRSATRGDSLARNLPVRRIRSGGPAARRSRTEREATPEIACISTHRRRPRRPPSVACCRQGGKPGPDRPTGVRGLQARSHVRSRPHRGQFSQSRPVTTALQSLPVTTALQSRPVTAALQSRPVTAALQSRPVTAALQSRPVTAASQSRPVTAALQSRPVTAALQSRPVTAASQSRPVTAASQANRRPWLRRERRAWQRDGP